MIERDWIRAKLESWNYAMLTAAVLAFATPALIYWTSPSARQHASRDFIGYFSAARIFLDGGNPYDYATVLEFQRTLGWQDALPLIMWSPPLLFAVIFPLAFMPVGIARMAWFLGHALLLIGAADLLWLSAGGRVGRRHVAWIMAVTFVPAAVTLNLGQISILLLTAICLFRVALRRERFLLACAATFLAGLKPQILFLFGLVLALWTLHNRRWRFLTGALAGIAIPSLFVILLHPGIFGEYLRALNSEYGPLRWRTASLGTLLRTVFPSTGTWIQFLPTFFGLLVGIGGWWRRRGGLDWEASFTPIVLLSTLAAAYAWTFDWVVLMPAVLAIAVKFDRDPWLDGSHLLSLIALQALLVLPLYETARYPATFWFPAAIGIVYMISVKPAESVEVTGESRDG